MSEENNIPATEVDIEAKVQQNVDKLRGLFRFDMYFLLLVPGFVIQLTAVARMGPLFILAVLPLAILILVNAFWLAEYYFNLHDYSKCYIFREIGKPLLLLMLMAVTIIIGIKGYNERKDFFKNDVMERMALSRVQGELGAYADNNDGKYPQADNWYDELFREDNKPYFSNGEFEVVLNPHALELGDGIPEGMVVGFICYNGSIGQVGIYDENVHDVGPILRYKTRDEKYSSSYNTIRAADAKYLKWTTDEPEIPVQKVTGVYSIMVCLILLLFSVMVRNRKYIIQNIIMMICISVLSIIIGGQFVQWAIDLYIGFNGKSLHDIYSVIPVLLFVFSCIFVLLMADYRARCQYEKCVGWVTLYGALVGIVCSCVLHCILMYVYDEYTIYPLLTGVPFGAWAGMILGWWAGSWLDRRHGKAIAGIEAVNE